MIKKLLTLTILLTTFIQADEGTQRDVCNALALDILEKGIEPCKENDMFVEKSSNPLNWYSKENFLRICKVGTINTELKSCVLRAEKDFGKVKDHFEYHRK